MQTTKTNELSFKVIHKHPNADRQEVKQRKETIRADLYNIFKKYV